MRKALLVALMLVANVAAWGQGGSISGNGGGISGNTGGGGSGSGCTTVSACPVGGTVTLGSNAIVGTAFQIGGGTADAVVIGGTTRAAGSFTTLASASAAITGGSISGTGISGSTGAFTTLSASAATTTAGITDSGNISTAGTVTVGSAVVLRSINTGQSQTFGLSAGAVLPANDSETTASGTNALAAYTSPVSEDTVDGWGIARNLTGSMVSVVTTTQVTPGTAVVNVNDTGANFVGALANGYFAIAPGIPDGTTLVSFTSVPTVTPTAMTVTLSTSVTLSSGVTVYFAPVMQTTTATTTGANTVTLGSVTGVTVGQVMVASGGANAYPAVSVTAINGLIVSLNANVTVASGTPVYFATHTGQFDTLMGVNVMGLSTQDSNNTMFGLDNFRDATGGNNTGLGATNFRDGTHWNDTAVGLHAIWASGATGSYTFDNVAVGNLSMGAGTITTANSNVFVGYLTASSAITSAANNAGGGFEAMLAITSGNFNASWGYQSLLHLTSGGSNNGFGTLSLAALTTGISNFGGGRSALAAMTTAFYQTAVGDNAMSAWVGTSNTANAGNAAFGASAGKGTSSSTYTSSTLTGAQAGLGLTTGGFSTFDGTNAGLAVTTGTGNTIIGSNVASVTLVSGTGNILIGAGQAFAATTLDTPTASTSNTINIGNVYEATGIGTPSTAIAAISGSLQIGSITPATLLNGDLAMVKTANSAGAPGAGFLKLESLAGTTGGTCKIVAYAGTSTTPVVLIDNVGSGC